MKTTKIYEITILQKIHFQKTYKKNKKLKYFFTLNL
jgi:hypothetical protein